MARARHETVNRRFKQFGCLSNTYRHKLQKHGAMFHAIANITQLAIMDNEPLFQVGYNENYHVSRHDISGNELLYLPIQQSNT